MDLAGQAKKKPAGEHAVAQDGYAMAALIVGMGIMALMMTVVMPVWKQAARREKEEELVFRGMQYVHAIGLYQRKFANAYPPNLDLLVDQKFLRKKFKDPITNDDFVILPPGAALPGAPVPGGQRGGTSAAARRRLNSPRARSRAAAAASRRSDRSPAASAAARALAWPA
ncbi:MAG: type II secretion system protein [Acidobacteria bacterium]|nr:type II secretion system protein [Acidobacteriota bacterium]